MDGNVVIMHALSEGKVMCASGDDLKLSKDLKLVLI